MTDDVDDDNDDDDDHYYDNKFNSIQFNSILDSKMASYRRNTT